MTSDFHGSKGGCMLQNVNKVLKRHMVVYAGHSWLDDGLLCPHAAGYIKFHQPYPILDRSNVVETYAYHWMILMFTSIFRSSLQFQ
jgi:hypothetical protein